MRKSALFLFLRHKCVNQQFLYLINGIAWYCIVLYCVVSFGARAVSRKTPIYFVQVYFWEIGHTVRLVNPHYIYHNWKKNIKSFAGCFTFQLFTKIAWYLCMTLSNSNNLSIQQLVLLCSAPNSSYEQFQIHSFFSTPLQFKVHRTFMQFKI